MNLKKKILTFLFPACFALGLIFILSGCGEGRPFSYRYTSAQEVIITYQNRDYTLTQGKLNPDTPFSYEFEPDGDVDIVLEGKHYEIDSPYDKDKKKTKKKKSTKIKTSKTKTSKTKTVKKKITKP